MQANALLQIHAQNFRLLSSFLSLLPDTVKNLVFTDLTEPIDWGGSNVLDALASGMLKYKQAVVSPRTLRLANVVGLWFSAMATLPTSFYAQLTTLDVYIVNRGSSAGVDAERRVFDNIHKDLVARSPALQDLAIRYRWIDAACRYRHTHTHSLSCMLRKQSKATDTML
jgi:hypothetical protein